MEYTKKFIYLSNQWYNDGLKKANIRDLSGAITSLKKSLQYNRDNIAARNLLGLVYYGRGEVAEALVEWIISKNMKGHGNIANYYIKKVQESASELDAINQAVKKFNQCLVYCQQDGEDLAAIQLRKVVAAHPTFLKAQQLLALLYMQTEQYAKARQLLRKAHKIDTTNEITLRYMHELKKLHKEKVGKLKEEKEQTISYKLGNETIIHPVSASLKDNATFLTVLNIAIGLAVGAGVVFFLVVPTMKKSMITKTNQDIIVYSEQIAARETEIDLLERELEQYRAESEATAEEKAIAQQTGASYEALVSILVHYNTPNYDNSKLVDELFEVNVEALGATGKAQYDAISEEVFAKECESLFDVAKKSFDAVNYSRSQECLERILKMNEGYEDGQAILMLMKTYDGQGNDEQAEQLYQRILEEYKDTELAAEATAYMIDAPADETNQ